MTTCKGFSPDRLLILLSINLRMNKFSHRTRRTRFCKWLFVAISLAAVLLIAAGPSVAQTVNLDRVVAELEPEIQRTLLAGNIASASIALISGDRVIWSSAYGYSNLWARTPATPATVYLIGSTFKAMSTSPYKGLSLRETCTRL